MFSRNGHKQRKRQSNAMIVVERLKARVFGHVPKNKIPADSFEKEYHGRWYHILGCDLEGQLWPIKLLPAQEGRLPTDLFVAKHCAEAVREVYGLGMSTTEKIKIGVLVALCVGILIVIFMIAAQGGA